MKLFFIMFLLIQSQAFAWNAGNCTKLVNNGWFRKYKYQGYDQPLTKGTKQDGSIKASSDASTESSTAVSDPKHWSVVSTSGLQGTSSWGDCSLFGLQKVKDNREKYVFQNRTEVLRTIAIGDGEHIDVLASYSLCEKSAYKAFATGLQKRMSQFTNSNDFGSVIDRMIASDDLLRKSCFNFSQL